MATTLDGLVRFDGVKFTVFNKSNSKGLHNNRFVKLFAEADGTLWASTEDSGLVRYHNGRFQSLTTRDGLPSAVVNDVQKDADDSLIIVTKDGLARWRDGRIYVERRLDFREYKIYLSPSGARYEIDKTGLRVTRKGRVENHPLPFDPGRIAADRTFNYIYYVEMAEDRDGRLWIGSVGGVEYLSGGRFTDYTERLGLRIGEADFWDIHQDRAGTLWFATSNGLLRHSEGETVRMQTEHGLPGNDVKFIHETSDGSLWVATYGGVAHFKDGRFRTFTEKDGLASNHVRVIYEDEQGTFWFGTYDGGLSRFRDGRFTNYTTDNGLYSTGVFQILEDSRGNYWMSSNQGIYRVSRRQLEDFAGGKIASITSTFYGKSDGMLNTECNGGRQPAGIKTRDGRLWFPTQDGVAIIDPEIVPFNPLPPPVMIESATIEGRSEHFSEELRVAAGRDNLEIRYTGLSFIKPEYLRFRYQLEGLDRGWTEAGTRRAAYYPYLPPGAYNFKVIAANSDGVWNTEGRSLRIVVLPPFYRTWWFGALTVIVAGATAGWIVRTRLRQLHQRHDQQQTFSRRLIESQEQERKRISAELHDSLGQQLLVIKNWAMIGLGMLPGDARSRESLDEISTAASQAIDEVRRVIYDLRPYQIDVIGLANTIHFMIEKVATASGIEFKVELGEIDDLFGYDEQITIYRIVQECVNNIVKHSQASSARVAIERSEWSLSLIVEDNGCGFAPEAVGKSASGGWAWRGCESASASSADGR